MSEEEYKVNRAASAASLYYKRKLYPKFVSCLRAAARNFRVPVSDVAKECGRRYRAVASKGK